MILISMREKVGNLEKLMVSDQFESFQEKANRSQSHFRHNDVWKSANFILKIFPATYPKPENNPNLNQELLCKNAELLIELKDICLQFGYNLDDEIDFILTYNQLNFYNLYVKLSALPSILAAHKWLENHRNSHERQQAANQESSDHFTIEKFLLRKDSGQPNCFLKNLIDRGYELLISGSSLEAILNQYIVSLPEILTGKEYPIYDTLMLFLKAEGCNPFSHASVLGMLNTVEILEADQGFKEDVKNELELARQKVDEHNKAMDRDSSQTNISDYLKNYYELSLYDEPRFKALNGYAKALDIV